MQQYNMDFIELMEQLDKLNEAYKAIEISEEEENEAKKNYLDHLKQGYVDLEEFHKAFDRQIKEQGLEKLFQDDGNLFRYSYGAVKAPTNELERAIKKLWVCVFSKDNPLPVGKDAYEEKQKQLEKEAAERAAREKEWAEWRAKKDAEEKAKEEEKIRIQNERIAIADKLGLDQNLLRSNFTGYTFKIGDKYETKENLDLDTLKSIPEDAKLAAVTYYKEDKGNCYYRSDEYFSWNSKLIDGEKFFKLKDGEQGIFDSGTTVYRDAEKVKGYNQFGPIKMVFDLGMDTWAVRTFEVDSSD